MFVVVSVVTVLGFVALLFRLNRPMDAQTAKDMKEWNNEAC